MFLDSFQDEVHQASQTKPLDELWMESDPEARRTQIFCILLHCYLNLLQHCVFYICYQPMAWLLLCLSLL